MVIARFDRLLGHGLSWPNSEQDQGLFATDRSNSYAQAIHHWTCFCRPCAHPFAEIANCTRENNKQGLPTAESKRSKCASCSMGWRGPMGGNCVALGNVEALNTFVSVLVAGGADGADGQRQM